MSWVINTTVILSIIIGSVSSVRGSENEASPSTSQSHISGAIFEKHGGYVHGFLSVAEKYSDNVLYMPGYEVDDFITLVSPGIWVSIPGGKEEIPETTTASAAPGGVVRSSLTSPEFRRLLAYAAYTPDLEFYQEHSDLDIVSHDLEASCQYRFRGGLSIGVLGQAVSSYDDRRTSNSIRINEYDNQLLQIFAGYHMSPKLTIEAGYSQFLVDYNAGRNFFRNRTDESANGSLSYHISPKSSLFTEYEFVRIVYDGNSLNDSDENHLSGGWRWNITDKSSGLIKAGWGVKHFERPDIDNEGSFRLNVQIAHQFTAKTKISINAYRRTEETNILITDYLLSNGISFQYTQKIRSKLQVAIGASWMLRSYRGGPAAADTAEETLYAINAGINWAFRKWLTTGIEYTYNRRFSDFILSDYTTNEILFRITASL